MGIVGEPRVREMATVETCYQATASGDCDSLFMTVICTV